LAFLLFSCHSGLAVTGVSLTVEGNDVYLQWPSEVGQTFIICYRPSLDPSTPWRVLDEAYAASVENETTYVHADVVVYPPPSGGGGGGGQPPGPGSWDDGFESDWPPMPPMPWDERYWSKPSVTDGPQPDGPDPQPLGSLGFYYVLEHGEEPDFGPLTDGLVLSGQYDFSFTPDPNYQNILGPLLDCNNNVTADVLVTTEPAPGHLRLNWHSTFIHYGGFFAGMAQSGDPQLDGDGPGPEITLEEKKALHAAYGESTNMDAGRVTKPNQAKMDLLPEHVLDYGQEVAAAQLRKDFQWIQEANLGLREPPPGVTLEKWMKIRMNSIHTQYARLQSVNNSLFRRFGRAINRFFPFVGGILFFANADSIAADFLSAAQDYASDILNGDDETGSAAILAGRCNDLAPGAGNIVLDYLLR
jgi:hypothetical protein